MNADFNSNSPYPISSPISTPKDKRRWQIKLPTPQAQTIRNTELCSHRVFAVLPSYEYYMHRLIGLEFTCFHCLLLFYTSVTHNFQLFEQEFSTLWFVNLAWTFSLHFFELLPFFEVVKFE
jgi:hypothetical protein